MGEKRAISYQPDSNGSLTIAMVRNLVTRTNSSVRTSRQYMVLLSAVFVLESFVSSETLVDVQIENIHQCPAWFISNYITHHHYNHTMLHIQFVHCELDMFVYTLKRLFEIIPYMKAHLLSKIFFCDDKEFYIVILLITLSCSVFLWSPDSYLLGLSLSTIHIVTAI